MSCGYILSQEAYYVKDGHRMHTSDLCLAGALPLPPVEDADIEYVRIVYVMPCRDATARLSGIIIIEDSEQWKHAERQ